MPKLNEYIGSLVSSITNARVMSDIQTIKVAEEYAKHNLLKHFSIPRMRIDDIEMTIPVALDEFTEKIETEFDPIDKIKFNDLVYNELVNNLGLIKLPAEVLQKLRDEIDKRTQFLEQNIRLTKDLKPLKNYSNDLISTFLDLTKDISKTVDSFKTKMSIESMPEYLEKILSQEIKIANQNTSIDNLNVIVDTHRLREQKPENIIYIKLKISEDGMEWNRTEDINGEIESKLLPE